MLLVKLTDGVPDIAPINLENFLLLYPATSFPGYLDASITEPLGYGIFSYSKIPDDYDKRTEKVVEKLPVRNDEEGVWYQQWAIEQKTPEELAEVDKRQRASVSGHRNMMLLSSDWTQMPDAPLTEEKKAEWRVYRQALRDLPNSEGFDPWNVSWPVPPLPQADQWQMPPNVLV